MAGTYQEALRPTLPGAYTRYVAARPAQVPPAPGKTVALVITHDWGPIDLPVLVGSFQEFQEEFGYSDTTGSRAVYDAFRGEGLEGWGGAGGVLVLRIGGTTAAKAAVTLDNPAAADAFPVTALYEGARGNNLRMVVGPIVSNIQEVSVYDGTTEVESYQYATNVAPALAGLRDLINKLSDNVRVGSGVGFLEGTTGLLAGTFPLTAGNNGDTLVAGDYTTALGQLSSESFAFVGFQDLPWAQGVGAPETAIRGIVASIAAWVQTNHDQGNRFTAAFGGALDELVADALARSATLVNENIITLGGPGVNDDLHGARSTSQLIPRLLGIAAQRGEGAAMHFARLAGTTARPKPAGAGAITLQDAEQLTNGGVIAIMRDRYAAAPVRLVKAVNTYVADTTDKPRAIYGNPKFVLSMQQFANECEAEIEQELIGKAIVSQETRDAAAARVLRKARAREGTAFQPGTIVTPVPGDEDDEHIDVDVTLVFGRALAQLFIRGNVR
jgi:hypothetical protein